MTEAVTHWIRQSAHPIDTVDPDAPLTDLRPLAAMVGQAKVVGLGGSTRGAHELSALSHRMLRFLVEELGFRSLAIEDDWTKGVQIDQFLRTGHGRPERVLADAWPPFRTEELLAVIRWMRSYNETHTGDPVRFVGLDISPLRALTFDAVTDYVRRAGPDRLAELEALMANVRPSTGPTQHVDWYREQPDKQPLIDNARGVVSLVESLPVDDGHALALHHARIIVGFCEYHADDSLAYAERRLAENTIWWHEYTGHRIVYWGGTGHTANASTRTFSPGATSRPERNAGSFLREHFGPAYTSIALTFDHGAVPYPVPAPPAEFADAALGGAGLNTFLLDLHGAAPPAVRAWLNAAAWVRLIGPTFDPNRNDAFYLAGGSLAEWFDLIVHSQVVTPVRRLTGDEPAAHEAVTRWVRDQAHPLTTTDPDRPFDDLEPLADLFAGAAIVGLGRGTHGTHELSTLTHRLLRFLVERLGFRALVVEENVATGVRLDDFVVTGTGEPDSLLAATHPHFRTEESRAVLRWMRSYNERHPSDPVRFGGVDVSEPGSRPAGGMGHVEEQLAENTLRWHRETRDKVVYWGGFTHTANGPARTVSFPPNQPGTHRNAGSRLREQLGSKYLSVGLVFDHGSVRPGADALTVPPVAPPFAETVLGTAGLDTYLLALGGDRPTR